MRNAREIDDPRFEQLLREFMAGEVARADRFASLNRMIERVAGRPKVKPRPPVERRMIGALAILVAALALVVASVTPGSPLRRLLVATAASPSPPVVLSPEATSARTVLVSASPSAAPSAGQSPNASPQPSPSATNEPQSSLQDQHLLAFSSFHTGGPSLSLANEDGTNPHQIGSGAFAAWSPSGRYLLASSTDGQSSIVMDITGAAIGSIPYGAIWSPDDELLVIPKARDGATASAISLYDVTGTLVRSFSTATGLTLHGNASWAPDGHAFVSLGCVGCGPNATPKDTHVDLWVFAADGSSATNITGSPREVESGPAWSPDGSSISYWTNCRSAHETCSTADWGTWLIAPDGTNPREIMSHIGGAVWSPDGSRLLYARGDTPVNAGQIFVSDADGSHPLQLSFAPGWDHSPQWVSADRVAYVHEDQNDPEGTVRVTRADGTQSEPDVVGADLSSFGWQP